jgi:hypothetical protein
LLTLNFNFTSCWDCKGPLPKRAQERNEQVRTQKRTPSLSKGITKHVERGPAGWWPTAKVLFFLSKLYNKKGRDLNIITLWPSYNLSVFVTLHSYCQCLWLSINFFLVKGNHLAFLPTMIEAWCTCRFRPCWNAA